MKAAVYEGQESIVVRDVPDPVLEDGEVLLKIEACCVCGSDRRTYRHGHASIPPPRVLGHEFCGTVVESRAAEHVDIKVGDRVVMYIVMPCGTCQPCKEGKVNICLTRKTMAYHFDGGYAEYTKIPAVAVSAGSLLKVESDTPSPHMALSEPTGCARPPKDRSERHSRGLRRRSGGHNPRGARSAPGSPEGVHAGPSGQATQRRRSVRR